MFRNSTDLANVWRTSIPKTPRNFLSHFFHFSLSRLRPKSIILTREQSIHPEHIQNYRLMYLLSLPLLLLSDE
jgi:hypothetical protein